MFVLFERWCSLVLPPNTQHVKSVTEPFSVRHLAGAALGGSYLRQSGLPSSPGYRWCRMSREGCPWATGWLPTYCRNNKIMKIVATNIKAFLIIAYLSHIGNVSLNAQYPAPRLEARVGNCINAGQTKASPAVCDVANGHEIEIEIRLDIFQENNLLEPSFNPNPIPQQGNYFLFKVIRESDNTVMPAKINITGGGRGYLFRNVRLYLEIPENKETRRAKADGAWKKLKEQYPYMNGWEVNGKGMSDALEKNLVENRLGRFKILHSHPTTHGHELSSL